MAIPASRVDTDGKLKPFTLAEIAALNARSRGIADFSFPVHSRSMNAATTTLKWFVNPARYEDALVLLLGAALAYVSDVDDRLHLSRLMPFRLPGDEQVACTKLESARGFKFVEDDIDSADLPIPTHLEADLELVAEICPFEFREDAYVGDSGDESVRYVESVPTTYETSYITLPGAGSMAYRVAGGGGISGTPVPFNVGVIRTVATLKKKWHRIPKQCYETDSALYTRLFGDPDAGTRGLVGTINRTKFLGYPAGCLLLLGVEEERVFDPVAGDFCYNLTYVFKLDSRGHNFMPAYLPGPPPTAAWEFVSNDAHYTAATLPDGKSIFDAREFGGIDGLFSVG